MDKLKELGLVLQAVRELKEDLNTKPADEIAAKVLEIEASLMIISNEPLS